MDDWDFFSETGLPGSSGLAQVPAGGAAAASNVTRTTWQTVQGQAVTTTGTESQHDQTYMSQRYAQPPPATSHIPSSQRAQHMVVAHAVKARQHHAHVDNFFDSPQQDYLDVTNELIGQQQQDADEVHVQQAVRVQTGLSRSDVLAQIEEFIISTAEELSENRLPAMEMVSRAANNVLAGAAADQDEYEEDQQQLAGLQQLGSRKQVRTVTQSKGAGAASYARVFKILDVVHELLSAGKQATQRDIYYKLSGPLFPSAKEVNVAIQDTVALLQVPRSSLGICCSSRGAVAGRLSIRDTLECPWQDCSALGMAGRAIPGDVVAIQRLSLRCSARVILVVEKDAIFQRLAEDRLWEVLPCVLITAKGFPDLATRAFLHKVHTSFPHLPVLGLVDWNPAGAAILATYKLGNRRMGLEAVEYAVPQLAWLGVLADMLQDVDDECFKPLTPRDKAMIGSLKATLSDWEGWVAQLAEMESCDVKADIEALYSSGGYSGLSQMLASRILQHNYIT